MCEPCKHDCMAKDLDALTSKLDSMEQEIVDQAMRIRALQGVYEDLMKTSLDIEKQRDDAQAEIERLKADLDDMAVGRQTWKKAAEGAELQIEALRKHQYAAAIECLKKAAEKVPLGAGDTSKGFSSTYNALAYAAEILSLESAETRVNEMCWCASVSEGLGGQCPVHPRSEKRKCICPNGTRTAIAHVSDCPAGGA